MLVRPIPSFMRSCLVVLFVLLSHRWSDGSQDLGQNTIMIRLSYFSNKEVTFTVAAGQVVAFANGESCGDVNHSTINGNRFFNHIHISHTLPQTGVDDSLNTQTVTTGGIKAYWDWFYGFWYSSSGAEDVTKNCHGYAFLHPTWIQDASYIDADDLQAASDDSDTEYFRQYTQGVSSHTVVWSGDETLVTNEKNEESRIYWTTWNFSTPAGTRKKRLYGNP